jgi:hypothetical protein
MYGDSPADNEKDSSSSSVSNSNESWVLCSVESAISDWRANLYRYITLGNN